MEWHLPETLEEFVIFACAVGAVVTITLVIWNLTLAWTLAELKERHDRLEKKVTRLFTIEDESKRIDA